VSDAGDGPGCTPLTLRVKVLMGTQGVAALITTGVVVARAVNILG
jgi:hypothetical protein